MFVISHAALPLIAAGLYNIRSVKRNAVPAFHRREIALIGCFGALPDILTPHISLADRYASWSHTAWFFAAILAACLLLARRYRDYRTMLTFCWGAVLLHLLCDTITGGVNFLPPFGRPIGDYYIPVKYWLQLDLVTMIGAYFFCWRARHLLLMREQEG